MPTPRCLTRRRLRPRPAPTFIMAIVCVFLLLAAMYESWRLPWAVLLGSPLVALGAFFGVWLMGYDNNVYVQVGLVMLIGLAAKNAILIVEFAKAKHDQGTPLEEAALESARLRFPAHPDDGVCLYSRRRAADAREWSWGRRSECDGHRGVLGHADRNRAGGVHHSRQLHLRREPLARKQSETARGHRSPAEGAH